jgi:hypothetical protein
MHVRTRNALTVLAVAGGTIALTAAGSVALASGPPIAATSVSTGDGARPESASLYAQAVFDAWVAGDGPTMVDLAARQVVELLAARSADSEDWAVSRVCDGAAGTVACSWTSSDVRLTVRVANQAASNGAAHAVIDASFGPAPGAVALWPLTISEEAWNTQAQVDAGHSPWMLDPEAVVSAYAAAELGFTEPVVESTAPTFFTFRVVDAATGVAVDIGVNQPARPEPGGIWTVARATSLPADPPSTPL